MTRNAAFVICASRDFFDAEEKTDAALKYAYCFLSQQHEQQQKKTKQQQKFHQS